MVFCLSHPLACMTNSLKIRFWHLSYWSKTWAEMPSRQRFIFMAILVVHAAISLWHISRQSVIYDEADYFTYVFQWATGHPERVWRIMDSKTPLVAFSLIPAIFKPWLGPHSFEYYLLAGRPFLYIYQLLGAFAVFTWLYRIWGGLRWVLPLLFYLFDPVILSYGMIIGSDLPSASLVIALFYVLWRYRQTGFSRYWFMICLFASLAVVLKASLVFFFPLLAVFLLWPKNGIWKLMPVFRLTRLFQFGFVLLLIINLAYYFKDTGTTLGQYSFESIPLKALQQKLSFLHEFPVPVPPAFIQGFDMLKAHADFGGCQQLSTYKEVFLFGRVECNQPIWYFYIGLALIKMPLLIWALAFLAIFRFFIAKNKRALLKKGIMLWLPFLYFLFVLSFLNKFQTGFRHAIPLLPFFYIGISGSIVWFYEKKKGLFLVFIFAHLLSIGRYWPNLMAFTNELVINKTNVYRLTRDSSVDYGQSGKILKRFLAENPAYKAPTQYADSGKFAIAIAALYARHDGADKDIEWLRENFEPVGHHQFSILLFEVSGADLVKKGLVK